MNHAMYVRGSVYMKCWPRQIHSDGKRKSGCQGPGEEEGRGGQLLTGCGISYRGDKSVFGTLKEMAVAWHSEGTNCRGTVCSKTAHRVSGEFHLSSSNKCSSSKYSDMKWNPMSEKAQVCVSRREEPRRASWRRRCLCPDLEDEGALPGNRVEWRVKKEGWERGHSRVKARR